MLRKDVEVDQGLSWGDVEVRGESEAVAFRREMEDVYRREFEGVGGGSQGIDGRR